MVALAGLALRADTPGVHPSPVPAAGGPPRTVLENVYDSEAKPLVRGTDE